MELLLHSQVSSNFKLSTQQQSLKMMQATVTKADELVKIKFIDRKKHGMKVVTTLPLMSI